MTLTVKQWIKQDALYVNELPKIGRVRFTTKIMQYAQTLSPPDLDVAIKQLLTKSKTLAKGRLSRVRGSLVDDLSRAERNQIRAGIVYGALGNNPAIFLDATTAHDDLLDFIVERRYRSIQRMLSFVNPNKDRMMLAYPPAGPLTAQVNKQSALASFWKGVTPALGRHIRLSIRADCTRTANYRPRRRSKRCSRRTRNAKSVLWSTVQRQR